jgi:alcohol dehydrogenase
MKAMILDSPGLENLHLQELPDPRPGSGEILVRLRAASLNYRDSLIVDGKYGSMQRQAGLIPLSDGAGEVVEVGPGVRGCKPGDRVVGCFFPDWQGGPPAESRLRADLGGMNDGVAAEYRCFRADAVLPIPPHMDFAQAATLPCAALTAWNAVRTQGAAGPEHCVLTQGTGGVSLFAVQFAAAAGARVIATSSSAAKTHRLAELGASHTINYRDDPDWGRTARRLADNRGVDLVVEIGGAGTMKQSMRATRMGGLIAVIGVAAGITGELNAALLAMNSVRLHGVAVGSRDQFADMLSAIVRHDIRPVIDRHFPLAALPEAIAYLRSGHHVGKVVIDIG